MTSPVSNDQRTRATTFASLHVKGSPLILYNIWDAGSARCLEGEGAKALATGSWSVAAAQGFADGEQLPIDLLLLITARITASVDLPVSIDFEGAYAADPEQVATHVTRLIEAGAIGCNFEDQIVGGAGLYEISDQGARIASMREACDACGLDFFINARTDLFLKERDGSKHAALMAEAQDRASAYAEAGASGFFVPGLTEPDLIGQICQDCPLPVNIGNMQGKASNAEFASLGASRISFGPYPYVKGLKDLASSYGRIEKA